MGLKKEFRKFLLTVDWQKQAESAGKALVVGVAGGFIANRGIGIESILALVIIVAFSYLVVVFTFGFYSYLNKRNDSVAKIAS